MRLVQVMIPTGKRETVLRVLDDEGIDYALTDETSGREYTGVVSFPLPKEAVEPVLGSLREAGIERDAYTVVLDAETVVSRRFEDLVDEYSEEENGDRIAREELHARAEDLAPKMRTFLALTILSAIVATAGLLLDSPAIVVGSMVIAPLVGPAMATSVGTVVDDDELFRRGLRLQFLGGVAAVASAALFAALLQVTGVVPLSTAEVFAIGEVRERLAPDILSVAVALAAGVAGALSLSSGVSTALVGVMIAAALVPPTAVVGIGLALGTPSSVLGAVTLVLVNFLSINVAALAVLWRMGYRPVNLFKLSEAQAALRRRAVVLVVLLVVLSAVLGVLTVSSYRTTVFEDEVHATVESAAAANDLVVVSTDVGYDGVPIRRPTSVTVVLGYPPGTDPPRLAAALAARVNDLDTDPLGLTDPQVTVEVQYVVIERASAGGTSAALVPGAGSGAVVPSTAVT